MNIVRRFTRAWHRFWFAPSAPRNLAAARIIIAAHALWILLSRDLPGISALDAALWEAVPPSRSWRFLLFHGHAGLEYTLQTLAIAALLAVLLGIAVRVAALAAALLLYHLAPLETVIWTPSPYERGFEVAVLALVILAVSPCADAWSVRARASRRDSADAGASRAASDAAAAAAGDYRWPLRLMQVLVAQIYLFSGWSKLFRAGPEWVAADNLRRWLLAFQQQDQIAVFTTLGSWIADRPALCLAAALGALIVDFGVAGGLFIARLRRLAIGAAVAFHAAILFAMNIAFLNLPQLLIFVDWDGVARRFGKGEAQARASAGRASTSAHTYAQP
jgi:hypothetical protein